MNLTNELVAAHLEEIGVLMRLAGENDFRASAFDRAARTIESLESPVADLIEQDKLTDVKGIGKSIAEDIYALAETGEIPVLTELRQRVPDELKEWLRISGLGPKKIYKIHNELGITTLDELKQKCRDGSVAGLSGMGKKSAEKILKSVEWLEQFGERCLLNEADEVATAVYRDLKDLPGVEQISIAGSLRRWNETIGDIDILIGADTSHTSAIFDAFTQNEHVVEVLGRGDTKSSVRTDQGRQVDLRIVAAKEFPAALMYFTGSKEHNVVLRQRARDRNLSLNEYGLFKLDSDGNTDFNQPLDYSSEIDIYKELDLAWVPPELREDRGEFEWFEKQESITLLEHNDICGVLHAHSTWSDGKYSIEQMARACIERGYFYLGLTDHSQTAAYAGGLKPDHVKRQWEEIDEINDKLSGEGHDFVIFKGIESDILSNGNLDYDDNLLDGFDFVIASIHSSLEMSRDKMMNRFKAAIEHPATRIIGHPTGRLLLQRSGSDIDLNQLIEWAVKHNTAIEINANPRRLDLDWRWGQKARRAGLKTAICPDAHTTRGIDDIRYGVQIARKAWFEKDRVLSCYSAEELKNWFSS